MVFVKQNNSGLLSGDDKFCGITAYESLAKTDHHSLKFK
jgi:hypothetical protein